MGTTASSTLDVPVPLICTGPPSPDRHSPRYVKGAWFDQAAVDRFLSFARHCRHTKGKWAGLPFELEPWQLRYIAEPVFGWKHQDGTRIVRVAWLELPRKSGKSSIATVIGLYLLCADREPGAEVYAAAWDAKQARMVFDPARHMVPRSPELARRLKPYRDVVLFPATDSKFEVLTSESDTKHGLNAHGVVVDEVHVHRSRDLVDTLETSTGSRTQPLVVFITTADDGKAESIYDEKRRYTERVAAGTVVDPSHYGLVYAADEGDDPLVEATWRKANPNFGVTVQASYFAKEAAMAKARPAYMATFKRLHLNLRAKPSTEWLPLERWTAVTDLVVEDQLVDRVCYGGLDLASTTDLAALCWDFPDGDGGHDAVWRFWAPQDRLGDLDARTGGQASVWAREGWLQTTQGDVIDYRAILGQIDRDARRFDVREVAYDRWGMEFVRQQITDDGLVVFPFGQGMTSMSPALKEWERLILQGRYRHGGNLVMRWMFGNLAVESDAAGNVKPSKRKAADKIDGCVAAVMALARAVAHAGERGRSVYEDRGVVTA